MTFLVYIFPLIFRTYLRTLATFPKPLVAGVVGNLMNLGVMQLPLLDYVVASEDCTFETSYAKLGQLPEGYALWHKHPKVSSQVVGHLRFNYIYISLISLIHIFR